MTRHVVDELDAALSMADELMIDAWVANRQGSNLQDDSYRSTEKHDPNSLNTVHMDASGSEREDRNIVPEVRLQGKVAATPKPPETPQDEEEEDLASLEKTWGEEDMKEEDEEKEEKDEEDKEEEDHASPKAPMFEHPPDPKSYFTTYVLQSHDGLSSLPPCLEQWAQHCYKEDILKMPEPGILDICKVAKTMRVDCKLEGKKCLLGVHVTHGNYRRKRALSTPSDILQGPLVHR